MAQTLMVRRAPRYPQDTTLVAHWHATATVNSRPPTVLNNRASPVLAANLLRATLVVLGEALSQVQR